MAFDGLLGFDTKAFNRIPQMVEALLEMQRRWVAAIEKQAKMYEQLLVELRAIRQTLEGAAKPR